MARQPKDGIGETTPKQFPEVKPTAYTEAVATTFLVESMMQMQKSIGEMSSTMSHLTNTVDGHGKKLDRISHIIFAAGVVLAICAAVLGFVINKIWDSLIALLTRLPTLPVPPAQ
jgi:hypothetical protein